MNERQTDFELLQDYVTHSDQPAFTVVVRRHFNLVYAVALRKLEDQGAAEEVVQNVFAALARKAWRFAPADSIPAWLYRAALLESREWLRGELRRRRREQTAAELGTTMKTSDAQSGFNALLPLLDEALLSLRDKDRTALLLRFYESQSLREVGASLGLSEDAAQKRVAGALAKVVVFFQRRGFRTATSATTAIALQHTAASASATTVNVVLSNLARSLPPAIPGPLILLARIAGLGPAQKAAIAVALLALLAGPVLLQYHPRTAATATLENQEAAAMPQPAGAESYVAAVTPPAQVQPSIPAPTEQQSVPPPSERRVEYTVHLAGLVRVQEFRAALLKIQHHSLSHTGTPPFYDRATVLEGAEYEDQSVKGAPVRFQALEIGKTDWTLKLRENGNENVYRIDGGADVQLPPGPGLCLTDFDFMEVVNLFGQLLNRTVLCYPGSNQPTVSVVMEAADRAEAAASLESVFESRGLKIVLEEGPFAFLVPTNQLRKAVEIANGISMASARTNSEPEIGINIFGLSLSEAAKIYAELAGQRMRSGPQLPASVIRFQPQTPLSRAETMRALQILFAWNGVVVEQVNKREFRLVPRVRR